MIEFLSMVVAVFVLSRLVGQIALAFNWTTRRQQVVFWGLLGALSGMLIVLRYR
jgi:hypothetical protein